MDVHAVEPELETSKLLAGAQFIDAYSVTIADPALDARGAAVCMFSSPPEWINSLMRVRNLLVTPFGLKTPIREDSGETNVIGIFPVLSESPDRLVAGLDDRHLNFRVAVDVASTEIGRRITATTLVRTHNRLGRFYLAVVLPFHRIVARAMLRELLSSRRAGRG